MESKEFLEAGDGVTKETLQSQPQIRRELDSMDDFEHLGHDSLHQKDNELTSTTVKNEVSELLGHNYSGDLQEIINKGVDSAEGAVNQLVDTAFSSGSHFDEDLQKKEKIVMDSNLIEKMEDFSTAHDEKEKMEKFFEDDNFGTKDLLPDFKNKDILSKSAVKTVTYDFMEAEKGIQDAKSQKIIDFETESPKHENLWKKEEPPKESFSSVENLLADDFRDVKEDFEQPMEPVKSKKDAPAMKPTPVTPLPSQEFKDASSEKISEKHQPKETKIKEVETAVPESKKLDIATPKEVIEAEVFFCKMGLDTWFNPEKLNPKVESLIYWRDPKKSGPVFGGVLVVLLALTYFSLISVIAYLSLLGLTGTISFRVYKNVVQAVQKTGEGHPFKEFLEFDLSLPPEKVKEISEVVVAHINAGLSALRRLFLVEDLIDSIKFGVFMWTLTYLGAWFNGMTLVILAWVALFTLPKVYETNKTQIDANLEIVKSKLAEITSKVKAAVPLGKKEEKKE